MSEIISIPILELMEKTEQWLLNQDLLQWLTKFGKKSF